MEVSKMKDFAIWLYAGLMLWKPMKVDQTFFVIEESEENQGKGKLVSSFEFDIYSRGKRV